MPVRQLLEHGGVFHAQCLRHKHDGLIQQRLQVAVGQRKLSERGDNGLLERAIQQVFFRAFEILDMPFQRFGHPVKTLGELTEFVFRGF